jgi:hypothetical protein
MCAKWTIYLLHLFLGGELATVLAEKLVQDWPTAYTLREQEIKMRAGETALEQGVLVGQAAVDLLDRAARALNVRSQVVSLKDLLRRLGLLECEDHPNGGGDLFTCFKLLRSHSWAVCEGLQPFLGAMASNTKVAVAESPSVVKIGRAIGPVRPNSPIESLSQAPSAETSPMSVVIKGLPADHSISKCMGVYIEQAERLGGRPSFVGGRSNDMLLLFIDSHGWTVLDWFEGKKIPLLHSIDSFENMSTETLSDLMTSEWLVCEQRKVPSSVRVEKKQETMLKLSGGQGFEAHYAGVYERQDRMHDDKYIYGNDNKAIWFMGGFGWCIGCEEMIGTRHCIMHADNFALTPDAVTSQWMVCMSPVVDPCVQVVLASAECNPSPSVQQQTPAPASASIHDPRQQELHSALENTPSPLMIAVVGVGEGYSGLYKKQQHTYNGKVVYEGSRADGNRVIYYGKLDVGGGTSALVQWRIGPCGSNGKMGCFIAATGSTAFPHTLGAVWQEGTREPCSSARVTKSKKKHTKVIEVKGMPADYAAFAQMNGKYRQQALTIDGRPTFKGGNDGNKAIWYSESAGSWRIGPGNFVGTAVFCLHAKDTASMPNTVKSTWEVMNGRREPKPYANIILPTFEAAEQEVPRQMQLKMAEVLVAEQKRCLGCGHEYTLQEEVVYHDECMHHHCMCCGEEQDSGSCAVCAAEKGKQGATSFVVAAADRCSF